MKMMLDIERDFVLDLEAFQIFEEITGLNIFEEETLTRLNTKKLSALFYAGLKAGGCTLTKEQTDKLVTAKRMKMVTQAIHDEMDSSSKNA